MSVSVLLVEPCNEFRGLLSGKPANQVFETHYKMLSSKVSTPIFAKSSSTRRLGEYQAGSGKTKTTAPTHKTLEEANLRIVQYEIAEREACKVLSTLCQEASQRLGIVDTEYEIDDKLSGILVLGNLYKRVGNEKASLESTIEKMKEEYTTLETEKNFMVGIVLHFPGYHSAQVSNGSLFLCLYLLCLLS